MAPRGLLASIVVLSAVLLAGVAAASGSGYNQSYTRGAGSVTNSHIDLVSVSSTDPGGSNITASFTVSGSMILNSNQYVYFAYFGGAGQSNSTAYFLVSNNSSAGQLWSSSVFTSAGFTIGSGGSRLSVSLAKSVVGPAGTFTINVEAIYSAGPGSGAVSWLGSNYSGGASCGYGGCATTPGGGGLSTSVYLYAGVGVAVIVVVIVVVLLLVMRGRKRMTPPPPPPPATGPPGVPPPGTPPPK